MLWFRMLTPRVVVVAAALLVAACGPAAPSPTAAPPKPAESKPPAPAVAPTQLPAPTQAPAPKPTVAPAAPIAAPAAQPTAAAAAAKPTGAAPAAKVPAPPATKPTKLDKVRYGIVAYDPFGWVIMAADAKKTMVPYGIDLELWVSRSGPAASQALAGGSLEIAATTPGGGWSIQEKAPEYKQILEVVVGSPYTLIVQPEINGYPDLKGKTFASASLTGGATIETLRIILAEKGLEFQRDYDVVVAGTVADRTIAMIANQVVGTVMMPPDTFLLLDRGKKPLDQAWKYPMFKDVSTVTLIAKQKWYTENKDIAVRFVQGYIATVAWLYDPKNRDETIKVLVDTMKIDTRYAQGTYDQFIVDMKAYPLDPRFDARRLGQAYANLKKLGQSVPENPMSLVDNSLIEAALR